MMMKSRRLYKVEGQDKQEVNKLVFMDQICKWDPHYPSIHLHLTLPLISDRHKTHLNNKRVPLNFIE